MKFVLDIPPSINDMYLTIRGRRVLSPEARAYKKAGILMVKKAVRGLDLSAYDNGMSLTADIFFVYKRKRDLDGGWKILQDVICEGLGINDNRVDEIHLYRGVDKANPRVYVEVHALEVD